jgi:hypothetical protein
VKVKVKLSLYFIWAPRHEGVLGSGGIAPNILYLGTRWSWVSFTPRPPYPQGKSPWYPLDRRLGWPQSRSGRGGEEKNSQPLPGLEPPIILSVAQRSTTELSRFILTGILAYACRYWGKRRKRQSGLPVSRPSSNQRTSVYEAVLLHVWSFL